MTGFTAREARHLRRDALKVAKRHSGISGVWYLLYFALFALALLLILYNAHNTFSGGAATNGYNPVVLQNGKSLGKLSDFCRQALLDHDSYGRDLSPDLKDYCGL